MHTTPAARAALDRFSAPHPAAAVLFFAMEDSTFHEIGNFPDIYLGLQAAALIPLPRKATGMGVYSTGKASKLNEDGEPDTEAEKLRCEVVILCDREFHMSSCVRLEGSDDDLETGDGEGQLADGLCLSMMLAMRRASALEDTSD